MVAVAFVVLAWWGSTAFVLGLVWQPERRHRAILGIASLFAVGAAATLVWSSRHAGVASAYVGFTSALVLWAWHELAFLFGFVMGPNRKPCAPGARGWERFRTATATLIHHEIALAVTLLAVGAASWAGTNHVGAETFLVLWVMRLSSKLNLFLGVRNVTVEFVPEKLRHLVSYFGPESLNPFMPVALLVSCVVLVAMIADAAGAVDSSGHAVESTVVATLLALGLLEHVFLCVRLSEATLWRWAMPARSGDTPASIPGNE
jgi:putative photosynthetic complex assembly protein 2